MRSTIMITAFAFLVSNALLHPHGFHKNTVILYDDSRCILSLQNTIERVKNNTTQYVSSYDQQEQKYVEKRVRVAGFSHVPFYCIVSVNNGEDLPIICSPTQHFYRLVDNEWVPAQNLVIGDKLLAKRNGFVSVTDLEFVQERLDVYTIHVKDTYTFLVGTHGIVAHNLILPVAATIGLGIPFSTGCGGGGLGIVLGPIGFFGGVVIGGVIGCIFNAYIKNNVAKYKLSLKSHTVATLMAANTDEYATNDIDEQKSLARIVVQVSPKAVTGIGCGMMPPQEPMILANPIEPISVSSCPGYRPLCEEERKILSANCCITYIPEQKKDTTIVCGGIIPIIVDASNYAMSMNIDEAQKQWAESDEMEKLKIRIKELSSTVSNARPGDWYKNPDSSAAGYEWAEKKWQSIRESKSDVKQIAANTGIDEQTIQQIKDHVFYKTHKKRYETAPFDADYDMAKAWERLEAGNMVKADLELLRHELAESLLMKDQMVDYDTAHTIVEKFFSWRNEL